MAVHITLPAGARVPAIHGGIRFPTRTVTVPALSVSTTTFFAAIGASITIEADEES